MWKIFSSFLIFKWISFTYPRIPKWPQNFRALFDPLYNLRKNWDKTSRALEIIKNIQKITINTVEILYGSISIT